ncbi:MAG: hypothetical protein IK123_06620 [Lachnospiraceae bacterium]|nr:hypothetical protein [Lachnospiraceae bacterium]
MNFSTNNDYSFLFGGSSGQNDNTGFSLNDYMSIKNGSYGKLMKAYYKEQNSDGKTAAEVKKETQSKGVEYSEIASLADKFETAAGKLSSTGLFDLKSVTSTDENGFETTTEEYDKDSIVSALKDVAKTYNEFLSKATKSTNKNVARRAENLVGQMTNYMKQLSGVGVKFSDDGTISIDEDKVRNTDIGALKRAFAGKDSMFGQLASKASQIGTAATSAANNLKGYNKSAKYASDATTIGNLLNDQA